MGDVKVVITRAQAAAFMKSAPVEADIQQRVNRMLAVLGDQYEGDVQLGRTRARGMVAPATPGGLRDNAKNNSLLKALGAAA